VDLPFAKVEKVEKSVRKSTLIRQQFSVTWTMTRVVINFTHPPILQ
jgi:hypothetical protein